MAVEGAAKAARADSPAAWLINASGSSLRVAQASPADPFLSRGAESHAAWWTCHKNGPQIDVRPHSNESCRSLVGHN